LGWAANFVILTVRSFADAVDPGVFPWALGVAAAWIAGLFSARLRERGWIPAGMLALFFLIPVLPLGNHTYHYYLTAPLAGIAWCLAAAFDTAFGSRPTEATARPSRRPGGGAGRGATVPSAVARG